MHAVPSNRRAAAVEEYGGSAEELLEGIDGEEDWVAPPPDSHGEAIDSVDVPSTDATAGPKAVSKGAASQAGGQDAVEDDDDIPDIDAMVLKDEEEDEVRCCLRLARSKSTGAPRPCMLSEISFAGFSVLVIVCLQTCRAPRMWRLTQRGS